jgi:uncharacterized membrane protein YidH (DUF202 family)
MNERLYAWYMDRLTGVAVVVTVGLLTTVAGLHVGMEAISVTVRGEWFTMDMVSWSRWAYGILIGVVGMSLVGVGVANYQHVRFQYNHKQLTEVQEE